MSFIYGRTYFFHNVEFTIGRYSGIRAFTHPVNVEECEDCHNKIHNRHNLPSNVVNHFRPILLLWNENIPLRFLFQVPRDNDEIKVERAYLIAFHLENLRFNWDSIWLNWADELVAWIKQRRENNHTNEVDSSVLDMSKLLKYKLLFEVKSLQMFLSLSHCHDFPSQDQTTSFYIGSLQNKHSHQHINLLDSTRQTIFENATAAPWNFQVVAIEMKIFQKILFSSTNVSFTIESQSHTNNEVIVDINANNLVVEMPYFDDSKVSQMMVIGFSKLGLSKPKNPKPKSEKTRKNPRLSHAIHTKFNLSHLQLIFPTIDRSKQFHVILTHLSLLLVS